MSELIWYWINLNDNVERRKHVESEFSKLKANNFRIEAIKEDRPHVGCCLSHIKAIYTAYINCLRDGTEYAIIMEDDVEFIFKDNLNLKKSIDSLIYLLKNENFTFDNIQLHYIEPSLIKGLCEVSKTTQLQNKLLKGYFMSCAFYLMSKNGMKRFLDIMTNLEPNSYTVKAILDAPNCRAEEMVYRYINTYTLLLPMVNTLENNKSQICEDDKYMNNNYNNMLEIKKLYQESNFNLTPNEIITIPYSLHWINNEKNALNFVKRIYRLKKEYFCFLHSGLGNRLFQFCSIYGLAKKNNVDFNILISASNFQHSRNSESEIYHKFFNINMDDKYPYPLIKTIEPLQCLENFEVKDKIFTYHCLVDSFANVIEENRTFENQQQFFNTPNNEAYIFVGFFQTEKYFIDYRNDILRLFKEPDYMSQIFKDVDLSEFTAIHVRLGDFLHIPKHFIDLNNYYKKSIDYCIDKLCKKFFIVSEERDINKIYEIYPVLRGILPSSKIVTTKNEIEDLYLMSRCKGVICSNSTFSWWGAWLNNNENPIITIPSKWMNDRTDIQSMSRAKVIQI
jgi:GR25 family glycosyltransferase involved in LPS biosynthesis